MAYGKKYVKKVTKKTYTKKASKGLGMAQKVENLQRQVTRLTKVAINKIQYQAQFSQTMATAGGLATYDAKPLLQFSTWNRCFGTDADDEVNKQALIRSITGRWQMASNEPDNRTYSIWVVSLKDQANELLNSDGTLGSLVQGTHYIGDSDRVLLNLKFFNVHYHRVRHSGVVPQQKAASGTAGALQNISTNGEDSIQTGRFSIKCGKNGMKVLNPSGDWKAGGYPKDPSKNYFFLNFWSGDSSADLEYPGMYVNTLAQVEVSG